MPYEDRLQVAIQTALSGDRNQAHDLLLAYIRLNSKNFLAWLWLSELAGSLKEQQFALEQAQALCPPDAVGRRDLQPYQNRLREALRVAETTKAKANAAGNTKEGASTASTSQEPIPVIHSAAVLAAKAVEAAAGRETAAAKPTGEQAARGTPAPARDSAAGDPFYRAERLARIGKREDAIRLLNALLKKEPQDERAWLLLSELETDPQEKLRLLQRVIALSPDHPVARQRLLALREMQENPLQRGQSLEEAGEDDQAIHLYDMVIAHSPAAAERIEANRRIANIRLRQESVKAQPIHPTLNLLRVTAGPVLLFAIMVFIQSGLNLENAPLLVLPGIACVLAGSFLISVTTMRPMHPAWIERFGAPGEGSEPETRFRLHLLGWLCMLAPFLIFFSDAAFRLGALRASLPATWP